MATSKLDPITIWCLKYGLAQVGKQVKNFTGAHLGTKIQLSMNKLSPTNMPIIKNQVQPGTLKV